MGHHQIAAIFSQLPQSRPVGIQCFHQVAQSILDFLIHLIGRQIDKARRESTRTMRLVHRRQIVRDVDRINLFGTQEAFGVLLVHASAQKQFKQLRINMLFLGHPGHDP